jgi:hypothetical protein
MIGRRLPLDTPLDSWPDWLPGDYCGPRTYIDANNVEHLALWFRPPTGTHLAHVEFPPHTFRECEDGSLEVRASIAIYNVDGSDRVHDWHGFLDEGHIWREC